MKSVNFDEQNLSYVKSISMWIKVKKKKKDVREARREDIQTISRKIIGKYLRW